MIYFNRIFFLYMFSPRNEAYLLIDKESHVPEFEDVHSILTIPEAW